MENTTGNAKLFAKIAKVMAQVRTLEKTGENKLTVNQHTALPMPERFWAKVDISEGPESCWAWSGYIDNLGYGIFKLDGTAVKSHRIAWELVNGSVPNNLHVCHHCDNRRCVNPAHLFLGTPADNSADMHKKGRARVPSGESVHTHKLSPAQVDDIRNQYANGGVTQRQLAEKFSITQAGIWAIVNNKAWRHTNGK